MGGVKANMGVALAACLALLFQVSSAATSHTVGDSTGWTIPPSPSFYSSWASKQTFVVGDFIVFNFQSGAHTVAEVSKKDYDACATTSPLSQLNNGPANLTISSAGTHYYICTIAGHCSGGQKIAITASAAASTSPPTSSPAPKSAAPTPKSTPSPTTAPSPKSTTTPTASPTPKSSPAAAPTPKSSPAAAPTPSAPTPATSAPSPMTAPAPGPSAAGSPESAAPGPASMSPANAPTPTSGASPPAPPTPTGAPASTPPASTPGSHSAATGAGLVLPLLAIIGANLLY